MEKYLVRIEFRYSDAPETEDGYTSKNKMVTIGVYDTFEEACKNGGILGGKKNLVASLAYLKTPFEFYTKIETLEYSPIDEVIENVVSASKRYRNFESGNISDLLLQLVIPATET